MFWAELVLLGWLRRETGTPKEPQVHFGWFSLPHGKGRKCVSVPLYRLSHPTLLLPFGDDIEHRCWVLVFALGSAALVHGQQDVAE